ncbi:MAG: DUF309 domain-containing protein, partial [Polyangiaceae bacterium]
TSFLSSYAAEMDAAVGGQRTVVQADALVWMKENPAPARASVVTSLPDVSELSHLDFPAWREWFMATARQVIRWVPAGGVSIFYQSDIRLGAAWIDKGYLVMRAAEEEGAIIAWHKVVCRKPAGTIGLGRPSYSHMICVTRETRNPAKKPGPDVLPDAGFMPWSKAMGVTACRVACQFLRDETETEIVVDPFCGRGTLLAVANAMGFAALGVDLGGSRVRAARALVIAGPEEKKSFTASEAFAEGARLFDAGAFWEAHEVWESRWRSEKDDRARRALQGLIQVAAAFHKAVVMASPESALRLFAKGIAKLDAPPEELALGDFRARVEECAAALAAEKLDLSRIPKMVAIAPFER